MSSKVLANVVIGVSAAVGVAAALWLGGRAFTAGRGREAGRSLQYDISLLRLTDPSLIRCDEAGELAPGVSNLCAVAVGGDDMLYAAGSDAVCVFTSDGVAVQRIAIGKPATCVAVDGETVYVGSRRAVDMYDAKTGAHIGEFGSFDDESILTCVAVGEDEVLVLDAGTQMVNRFGRDGALKGRIGGATKDMDSFVIPSSYFDAAFAPDGSLWVVNPGRQMLINFSNDGRAVSSWRAASMTIEGFCGCCNPSHIAIRADGSIITSEKGLPRVKLYGPGGNFAGVVAGCESFGAETRGLDLAVDSNGRIIVVDPDRGLLRFFVDRKSLAESGQ